MSIFLLNLIKLEIRWLMEYKICTSIRTGKYCSLIYCERKTLLADRKNTLYRGVWDCFAPCFQHRSTFFSQTAPHLGMSCPKMV
jgi:hypothetical protein